MVFIKINYFYVNFDKIPSTKAKACTHKIKAFFL